MYSSTSPFGLLDQDGKPVVYDAQTVQLYKQAVQLHQDLQPYIQGQVARTLKTGEPIIKPIFFDYPTDQASYGIGDDMFGLVEEELNREGLTMGVLAHPPKLTTFATLGTRKAA